MDTENAVRELTASGNVADGAAVETGSPMLVEVCGWAGLDWVWIDFEHKNASSYDSTYLEHFVRAAECADTELVVRVPNSDPALVRKVLDSGVRNVLVPRVTVAAEVRAVVSAARFRYDGGGGQRGLAFGRSSAYGGAVSTPTSGDRYDAREDATSQVGLLIEERGPSRTWRPSSTSLRSVSFSPVPATSPSSSATPWSTTTRTSSRP